MCIYIYIYVCMYVCVHRYIHIYCINTYIHICIISLHPLRGLRDPGTLISNKLNNNFTCSTHTRRLQIY